MTTLITHGASTITPVEVLGYEAARQGGNIIHPILGRANPDVTFRPAALRTGTLELAFTSETDSKDAEDLFATGGTFALVSTDRSTIAMSFVVAENGRIVRTLEPATGAGWLVSVDYQEVDG